jgi:RNA polymerase sigma factor (sigma-70 family)
MSKVDADFQSLMLQVMAGSDEAAHKLFTGYAPYLLRAIRRRLGKQIRSKFDSADFAQDVWVSFFAEPRAKRVFATPNDLVAFLTRLAQNKVIDATRQRTQTQKHDVRREQSIDDSTRFDKETLTANQATPSQIVMTQEDWKEFLRKQPPVYRRMFILLREGKTQVEIAEELGVHPRTVSRVMSRLATE